MRSFAVLLLKEETALFSSPIAYVVMTVFLLIMGYSFTLTLFLSHQPSMVHVFFQMFVLFMLTAPLITMRLLAEGRSFDEIAKIRSRQLKSVIDLVASLVEKGDLEFQPGWIDDSKQAIIEEACSRLGMERLKPIKEALPPEITYEEIRLVAARLRRQQQKTA